MKKRFCIFLLLTLFMVSLFGIDGPNFRTALRYAQVARGLTMEGEFSEALTQVEKGLAYDENFSDLLYIKAFCLSALDEKKYLAKECVEKAVINNSYREINPQQGRILYASYLADTMECEKALEVLDATPVIFTSDSEYLRALANYRLGNYSAARRNISNGRKVFGGDTRFPLLFFSMESPFYVDVKLVEQLLKLLDKWKNEPEILVYASKFVEAEKQLEMLKEYESLVGENISFEYVLTALECQYLEQNVAVEKFISLMKKNIIKQNYVERLINYPLTEDCIKTIQEFMTTSSYVLSQDFTKDTVADFFVYYENGKLCKTEFYEKQDDRLTFQAQIKENSVTSVNYEKFNMDFDYYKYPDVERMKFSTGENIHLVSNEIHIKLLDILPFEKISSEASEINMVNIVSPISTNYTFDNFIENISSFTTPTDERRNGYILFTVLNGNITSGNYYNENGKQFAFTAFDNGLPIFRNVDGDDDGNFEITEYYNFNKNDYKNYQSENEKIVMDKNLFGTLRSPFGLYLEKIEADLNKDYICDYFEIFKENNTKICGWDTDGDGIDDIGFVNYPDGCFDIFYKDFVTKENVYCKLNNNVPISILKNNIEYSVTKDHTYDLYWIGDIPENSIATYLIENVQDVLGVQVYEVDGIKIIATKVGDYLFGEVIDVD